MKNKLFCLFLIMLFSGSVFSQEITWEKKTYTNNPHYSVGYFYKDCSVYPHKDGAGVTVFANSRSRVNYSQGMVRENILTTSYTVKKNYVTSGNRFKIDCGTYVPQLPKEVQELLGLLL